MRDRLQTLGVQVIGMGKFDPAELRREAERAGSLLGENRTLREELDKARQRLEELESAAAALKAERDKPADPERRAGESE